MALVTVTEAANLTGVSRGTIYNKIESGELPRSPDGIDTAELIRVFGEISLPSPTRQQRHGELSDDDSSDTHQHDDGIAQALLARLDAADAEKQWFREMYEKQKKILEERNEQLHALLPAPGESTPLEQAQREIGRYEAEVGHLKEQHHAEVGNLKDRYQAEVEHLKEQLEAQLAIKPRKKIFGLF